MELLKEIYSYSNFGRAARMTTRRAKAGPFKSRMIGKKVKIVMGEEELVGKTGEVVGASREHTFSQMVPFVIEYTIKLDDSEERVYIRKEHVRPVKPTQASL